MESFYGSDILLDSLLSAAQVEILSSCWNKSKSSETERARGKLISKIWPEMVLLIGKCPILDKAIYVTCLYLRILQPAKKQCLFLPCIQDWKLRKSRSPSLSGTHNRWKPLQQGLWGVLVIHLRKGFVFSLIGRYLPLNGIMI